MLVPDQRTQGTPVSHWVAYANERNTLLSPLLRKGRKEATGLNAIGPRNRTPNCRYQHKAPRTGQVLPQDYDSKTQCSWSASDCLVASR